MFGILLAMDRKFLDRAIELATQSTETIGCGVVIVSKGEIVAEAINSQQTDNIAINHAEIKAIWQANVKTGQRKLDDATAFCSCEPCAMCLVALSYAKVKRIVFNKRMVDIFPDDPQSQLDIYTFVKGLNFVPELQQIVF